VSEGLNIGLNKSAYVEWIKVLFGQVTGVKQIINVQNNNNTPLLEAVIV
jgi:hypothetical protein